MKTDTYTKTILTIIAVCLTINVVKDFEIFPSAYAHNADNNTAVSNVEASSVMDVRLVDIRTSNELNVNLKNVSTYQPVPVNLKKIETSDKLQTNISEIGGRWMSHGGPVPVKKIGR